jgi:hypothetical protein
MGVTENLPMHGRVLSSQLRQSRFDGSQLGSQLDKLISLLLNDLGGRFIDEGLIGEFARRCR